jgi:hypothetical protein
MARVIGIEVHHDVSVGSAMYYKSLFIILARNFTEWTSNFIAC